MCFLINVYSDNQQSTLKYLKNTEVNLNNIIIMTEDFNIRNTDWNPLYLHHLIYIDMLREITNSFNLELLSPVVATTCRNGTCSMLASAKLSVGYLVVGIIRELDKEPLLHCSSIYINTMWFVLQQCVYLMSYYSSTMLLPQGHHAFTSRLPCHVHVPWHHTL